MIGSNIVTASKNIVWVGGPPGSTLKNIEKALNRISVKIVRIVVIDGEFSANGADAIAVNVEMCSHNLFHRAQSVAAKWRIPLIVVSSSAQRTARAVREHLYPAEDVDLQPIAAAAVKPEPQVRARRSQVQVPEQEPDAVIANRVSERMNSDGERSFSFGDFEFRTCEDGSVRCSSRVHRVFNARPVLAIPNDKEPSVVFCTRNAAAEFVGIPSSVFCRALTGDGSNFSGYQWVTATFDQCLEAARNESLICSQRATVSKIESTVIDDDHLEELRAELRALKSAIAYSTQLADSIENRISKIVGRIQ